jgi:Tfp pilus assembly protein PilV
VAGFTVAEVLVSLALLATGVLALSAAAHRLHGSTRSFLERERAYGLAAWAVDSLLATDTVEPGVDSVGELTVTWRADGGVVRVRVLDGRRRALADLAARRGPYLPLLPAASP